MPSFSHTAAPQPWSKVHDAYLEAQLQRLRLQAEHRIRWLRAHRWRTEPLNDETRMGDARVDRLLDATAPDPPQASEEAGGDLAQAVASEQARVREHEAELSTLGSPPALTILAEAAGLSEVAREAVLIALAAELDPAFRTLYAYLQDDPALRCATPGLVADLMQRSLPEVWELLDSQAPLHRFRLVEPVEASGIVAPLRLDARVVGFLRGHNAVDARLAGLVEPLDDLPLATGHRELAHQVAAWLADPDRRAHHTVVNLVGPRGQGREAVAAAVARALRTMPLRLHADRVAARGDPDLTRLVDRETLLLPAALYADAPESPDEAAEAARRILDAVGGLLLVGSRHRHDQARATLAVDVPPLRAADRRELWQAALPESSADDDAMAELAEEFALGPVGVLRAAGEAIGRAELAHGRAGVAPGAAELRAASRTAVGRELGELAQRLQPAQGWDTLVLPQLQRELLAEISAQVSQRARVYGSWGFASRLARGQGITALFAGPSGTGKTMAAEIMAGELGLELYRIDLSSVVSKYIGETEKNLRRVFDAAEQGGAILFFDEADALFGKRTEVSDSHDRHANVEINYLLQRMEDYRGLAILATNRKGDLDPAFLRRLRFIVTFPFPRVEFRRRIWEAVFPPETPLADLDYDALSRLEIAGGNIHNIAVNAAFLAAGAGQPVGMAHVMRAAGHEYAKLDRKPSRSEFGAYYEAVRS